MSTISEDDVRVIVRLLGEVAVREGTLNDKRVALMAGLVELIDADAWIWGVPAHTVPGEHPALAVMLKGGFTDAEYGALLRALEHPDMGPLQEGFAREMVAQDGQITRLRQQIVSDEDFLTTEVAPLWKAANFGPLILSARPKAEGQGSAIGIYRHHDRPAFTGRESKIAHIILSEVAWLHESLPMLPDEEVVSLSPRLRQVMNCLLVGKSRKEIALQLGLPVHTLGDYIKQIYQRFGVQSHPALLRKFFIGDGGDTP